MPILLSVLWGGWQKSLLIWPFKLGSHSFPQSYTCCYRVLVQKIQHIFISIKLAFNIIFINSIGLWVSSHVLLISTWSDSDLLMTLFQAASSCYYIPIDLYNNKISCTAYKSTVCVYNLDHAYLYWSDTVCASQKKVPWHCTMHRKFKRSFEGISHPVSLLCFVIASYKKLESCYVCKEHALWITGDVCYSCKYTRLERWQL